MFGQAQDHVAGRAGAPGLDEAQMPARDVGRDGQVQLAEPAALAPPAEQVSGVRGPDAIAGLIGAAQQQFPGLEFTLGGPADANHNQARFTWHLGPSGGEPIVIGFDVMVLDDDGRIRSVHGFLDRVPAAA